MMSDKKPLQGQCRQCGGRVELRRDVWAHDSFTALFGHLAGWITSAGPTSPTKDDFALAGPSKGAS